MACKADSECPRGQVCNDGACEPMSGFSEEKEVRTFEQARHERSLQMQSELRQMDIYSQFLNDEIQEAIKEREEEAADIDFWGTIGAIGGGILGGIAGIPGGPAGIVTGATIGAGAGSGVTRYITDELGDAEDYGLSDTEMAMFDESDFKYLKEEFFDLYKEGGEMQADLDEYDDDQWKTHVMNTLTDTWTAFDVANKATSVASVMQSLGSETVEEAAEQTAGRTFTGSLMDRMTVSTQPEITAGGWSEQISDITQSMKSLNLSE